MKNVGQSPYLVVNSQFWSLRTANIIQIFCGEWLGTLLSLIINHQHLMCSLKVWDNPSCERTYFVWKFGKEIWVDHYLPHEQLTFWGFTMVYPMFKEHLRKKNNNHWIHTWYGSFFMVYGYLWAQRRWGCSFLVLENQRLWSLHYFFMAPVYLLFMVILSNCSYVGWVNTPKTSVILQRKILLDLKKISTRHASH